MSNKLFCTFTTEEYLPDSINQIQGRYKVAYNRIFVLYLVEQDEYMCTYNTVEPHNSEFLENTILVHRKKETNTLYTINALNELIRELNYGVLDKTFKVEWRDFRNTLLLTKGRNLVKTTTKLYEIVEI